MLGNKRATVVSGRLNFPVKKKLAPLPNWIDKDPVVEGISGIQMPGRRFVDLGTVPVPRPTGPRADKRRQNKVVETSRWVGSTYCLLDNNLYGMQTGSDGVTADLQASKDYFYPDIVIPAEDTSRAAAAMFSAPIGLRVMQQHYGARSGVDVGPNGAYYGYTVNSAGNTLVSGSSSDVAWESGVLIPANSAWNGSYPISSTDTLKQAGSLATGSMWFNQLGFQWCPIGVNHLDKNDFAKLSEYKYFRFKKFGMRITFDGPTFHKAKKNEVMTSYQYAPPVNYPAFVGASNSFHGEGSAYASAGHSDNGWRGDASLDFQAYRDFYQDSSGMLHYNLMYNTSRAGPKYSCVQPYGVYDYMIIGPEQLKQLDLPALMGYSDKAGATTQGLGALHVWDTLREHGIPVHRAKKNYIDIEWKPYTINLKDDANAIGDIPYMDQDNAGPYGPSVELATLARISSAQITPRAVAEAQATALNNIKQLPYLNGYPYAHIGPVVLVRFAADPGVSAAPTFSAPTTPPTAPTLTGMITRVNPICASVPIHVKCWSTYEAYGEDFETFDTSTLNMWKAPVGPAVFPYNNAAGPTVDPTNAG